jgi:hypothetical protein
MPDLFTPYTLWEDAQIEGHAWVTRIIEQFGGRAWPRR